MLSKAAWQWVACAWYLFFFASEVCIDPFINVYMKSQGLSEQQIGVTAALRPWVGVVASFVWGLAADYFHAHRPLIIILLLASNAARLPLPWASSFGGLLSITLANRTFGSSTTVMADAAVTGCCSEDGEYGRYRLWGAVGWGGISTLGGMLSDAYGIKASLLSNLSLMVPCVILSWFLFRPKEAADATQETIAAKRAQLRKAGKDSFCYPAGNDSSSNMPPFGTDRSSSTGTFVLELPVIESNKLLDTNGLSSSDGLVGQDHLHHRSESSPAMHGSASGSAREHATQGAVEAGTRQGSGNVAGHRGVVMSDLGYGSSQGQDRGQGQRMHGPRGLGSGPPHFHDEEVAVEEGASGREHERRALLARSEPHTSSSSAHTARAPASPGAAASHLPFSAKLRLIFSRTECLVFFWATIVMGFGMGMIDSYLFLLLKDMGAADVLLGMTLTVTCMAEVPVFQLQGLMLRKLGSPDALIDVSLAAYTVRMLCYAVLPTMKSPWWVLTIEPLHGLTFGCGWGAGCEKSKALAPPGLEATQQGIFQSLYFGLGTGLGALAGGSVAQHYGFRVMFLMGGVVVAAGWLVSIAGRVYLSRHAKAGHAYAAVALSESH